MHPFCRAFNGPRTGDKGCQTRKNALCFNGGIVVCAENFIRIDLVTESHNVGHDGRADISLLELGCLAVLVVNSMQLARDAELDDPLQDVGSLQNDFWDCRGSIPAARGVGSRDPRVAAADHRAATR